jgi:hypothetical protein
VIDLGRQRAEILPVRGVRRGHRQRQLRASVERATEGDHACAARVGACDLDGVLGRFRARREQNGLVRLAHERGEASGELDVFVVHQHLKAGVRQPRRLIADGLHNARVAVAHVEHADPGAEVEVLPAVGVPDTRSFRARHEDRMRIRKPARDPSLARGYRGVRLESRHSHT